MKTIGIIGGMSWESTAEYYRIINEVVKEKLGGYHSAKIIMYSVEFAEVHHLQFQGEWDRLAEVLKEVAHSLERAGADFLIIATNTMHKLAPEIEGAVSIPLLHIADATAREIKRKGFTRVGLLGTKFTMEMGFYRDRLQERHGIEVVVPDEQHREFVNRVIYDELVLGVLKDEARKRFKEIIDFLVEKGAQGVILGCTEIPLLVKQRDVSVPIFDTTFIHARAAVDYALSE